MDSTGVCFVVIDKVGASPTRIPTEIQTLLQDFADVCNEEVYHHFETFPAFLMESSKIFYNIFGYYVQFLLAVFFQIGLIVLALHDASDVFMKGAKVFIYSEKELAASKLFGFFALSWFILRLIFLPFWMIRNTSYDLIEFLNLSEAYLTFLYCIFNTMLMTLLLFNTYWWILMYSVNMRQLKK